MATTKTREHLIWILLALSLVATVWVSMAEEKSEGISTASKPHTTFNRAQGHPHDPDNESALPVATSTRGKIEDDPVDLFSPQTSVNSNVVAEEMPKQPEVPVLPYTYAGKLVEGDSSILFLTDESRHRNYAIHKGDVIDRIWRVDEIDPAQITFSHIPSKAVMSLLIGDSN